MNETYLKTCPDCETYIIEMVGGVKHAHYNGYVYGCDDGKGWKAQEMTYGATRPSWRTKETKGAFFERLCHEAETKQQYVCDLDEAEAFAYRDGFTHLPMAHVNADTPCGLYWCTPAEAEWPTRQPPPYALDRCESLGIRRRPLHITAPTRQGTGSRRGSLQPPRRQVACRPLQPRLRAQPAHRPTLRAPCGTRVDCLRSRLPPRAASHGLSWPSASAAAVESGSFGTVPARSSHVCRGLPTPPPHCASRSARNFQKTFCCAKTFPQVPFFPPLTRFGEGVRRGQAVRRRAGHGASAAPLSERHSHG